MRLARTGMAVVAWQPSATLWGMGMPSHQKPRRSGRTLKSTKNSNFIYGSKRLIAKETEQHQLPIVAMGPNVLLAHALNLVEPSADHAAPGTPARAPLHDIKNTPSNPTYSSGFFHMVGSTPRKHVAQRLGFSAQSAFPSPSTKQTEAESEMTDLAVPLVF